MGKCGVVRAEDTFQREQFLARCRVPNAMRSIFAGGGNACAIGREMSRYDDACMPSKREDKFACRCIPNPRCAIAATGDNVFSIGTKSNTPVRIGVTCKCE